MTLQEAIKSGKPFRRSIYAPSMYISITSYGCLIYSEDNSKVTLEKEDILADDWEVKEERVQITKTQFYSAVHEALKELDVKNNGENDQAYISIDQFFTSLRFSNSLAKKLGLE